MDLINDKLTLSTQNKTNFVKSVRNEKENEDLKISWMIETSEIISSSKAKMRDHKEKKNRNKKSQRHVYIICKSIVKHITGPGISKLNHVQVKAHPRTTTYDIIDYKKPTIRQKPGIFLNHSGKNDLSKDVNTMGRVRKRLAKGK